MNESVTTQKLFQSDAEVFSLPPNGRVTYQGNWLEKATADRWLGTWQDTLDWKQRPIRMFGREVMQPRLTCLYGEEGVEYRYSGKTMRAQPWGEEISVLAEKLSDIAGSKFNSVLCNLYRDGQDGMGWHADNERELGQNPVIASLSLGQARRFRLKPRASGSAVTLMLEHGSLLLMQGDVQHHWLHELPKSRRPMGPRINLTFRRII